MVAKNATKMDGMKTYFQLNPNISLNTISNVVGIKVAIRPSANSPIIVKTAPKKIVIDFMILLVFRLDYLCKDSVYIPYKQLPVRN